VPIVEGHWLEEACQLGWCDGFGEGGDEERVERSGNAVR
jgi:hypothetical protein